MSTCPHGTPIATSQLKGTWFGGMGTCACCQSRFGILHSATYGDDGELWSITQDETLCPPCGGKRVEYLHPDYEWITHGNVRRLQRRAAKEA
jgi:hypothetical protein